MINKIRRNLMKEIRQIKRKMVHNDTFNYSLCNYCNANQYFVILKDGVNFNITSETTYIPEFKYKDVVYILKEFVNTTGKRYIDTNIGAFNGKASMFIKTQMNNFNKYSCDPYKTIDTRERDEII